MKKYLFLIFVFASYTLPAQNSEWMCFYETNISTCLGEDSDYIWAGSLSGITRINKTTGDVTWFNEQNTPITERYIRCMTVDNLGNKWFCSDSGYLYKLAGSEWTVIDSSRFYIGNNSNGIVTGDSNDLWIDTNSGVVKYDGTRWYRYQTGNTGVPLINFQSICFANGILWGGYINDIYSFDGTSWSSVYCPSFPSDLQDIKADSEGNLWFLHEISLEKFDGNTFTVYNKQNTNLPNVPLYSLEVGQDNILWIACKMYEGNGNPIGGIMSFSNNSWTKYDTANTEINSAYIHEILLANDGNIWFLNTAGDIGKFNLTGDCSYYDLAPSGLDSPLVRHIVTDIEGNAYIAGSKLYKTNLNTWDHIPFYECCGTCLCIDASGNLYSKSDKIYTYNGINVDTIPNCPYLYNDWYYDRPKLMVVSNEGEIWMDYTDSIFEQGNQLYTYNGIAHFNGSSWAEYNIHNSPLPSPYIHDIKIAPDGSVWLSTHEELVHIINGIWTIYNSSNSAIPDFIGSIAIDQIGSIWFSDFHFGLYRFTGTEIEHYAHPVMGNEIGSGRLAVDVDGSVWQHFNYDVMRFDGTSFTHHFNEYNSPMGTGELVEFHIDDFGNKWIGTTEGFVVYREGGVITGLEPEFINSNQSVHTFPNPFTEQITFSFDQEHSLIKITIFDALGKLVYKNLFRNTDEIFVKTNLRKGLYFYRIETNNGQVFSGKISGGSK